MSSSQRVCTWHGSWGRTGSLQMLQRCSYVCDYTESLVLGTCAVRHINNVEVEEGKGH
jgi:hypothetical protein